MGCHQHQGGGWEITLNARRRPFLLAERNQFLATRSGPADEQALQKCRIALQTFRFRLKPRLYWPLWPADPLRSLAEGIENMVIESVLLIAFVVIVGAAVVKAYEWHHDVLYGPYIKADRLK
jgi:hypothetical protein